MTLFGKALVYTLFYAALVYLPLRLIVGGVSRYQLRAARKKAEHARKELLAREALLESILKDSARVSP
jgi:hypothetical protein